MVENKLLAVQQGPEKVVEDGLEIFGVSEEFLQIRGFVGSGLPAEAAQVESLNHVIGLFTRLEQSLYDAAFLNLVVDRRAIQKMQRLGKIGLGFDFARADGFAAGPTER